MDANGNLYTGSIGGDIYKISEEGKKIETLTNIKPSGRPLGMKVDPDDPNLLHVLDAFTGIYSINLKTKEVKLIYDIKDDKIDHGKPMVFIDDFAKDGSKFYITDSTEGLEEDSAFLAITSYDSSGRVIEFDTETKKITTLATGLAFPNGIEITDDKNSVLVVELTRHVLWKIYVRGPKRGQKEALNTNLPGWGDNIRRSTRKDRETYWIAFFNTANNIKRVTCLSDKPALARGIANFLYNIASGIEWVNRVLIAPLEVSQLKPLQELLGYLNKFIKGGGPYLIGMKMHGLLIEVDSEGKIIRSLHSPDGKMSAYSEAREVIESDGSKVLYIGSAFNDYVGKLKLEKVAESISQASAPSTTTARPETVATQSKPKETTTTTEASTTSSTITGESVKLTKTKTETDSVSSKSTAKANVGSAKEKADKGSNK